MLQVIITSSLLILIVLALRFALRGKLAPTVIYAMWAVVALRLLILLGLVLRRLILRIYIGHITHLLGLIVVLGEICQSHHLHEYFPAKQKKPR